MAVGSTRWSLRPPPGMDVVPGADASRRGWGLRRPTCYEIAIGVSALIPMVALYAWMIWFCLGTADGCESVQGDVIMDIWTAMLLTFMLLSCIVTLDDYLRRKVDADDIQMIALVSRTPAVCDAVAVILYLVLSLYRHGRLLAAVPQHTVAPSIFGFVLLAFQFWAVVLMRPAMILREGPQISKYLDRWFSQLRILIGVQLFCLAFTLSSALGLPKIDRELMMHEGEYFQQPVSELLKHSPCGIVNPAYLDTYCTPRRGGAVVYAWQSQSNWEFVQPFNCTCPPDEGEGNGADGEGGNGKADSEHGERGSEHKGRKNCIWRNGVTAYEACINQLIGFELKYRTAGVNALAQYLPNMMLLLELRNNQRAKGIISFIGGELKASGQSAFPG